MQNQAQSAPFSSAKQAICNDAMRPNLTRQMCRLLCNGPLVTTEHPALFHVNRHGSPVTQKNHETLPGASPHPNPLFDAAGGRKSK